MLNIVSCNYMSTTRTTYWEYWVINIVDNLTLSIYTFFINANQFFLYFLYLEVYYETIIFYTEVTDGSHLHCRNFPVLHSAGWSCLRLLKTRRYPMNWLTLISGIAATGLLIYLVAVLLHPEDFS